MQFNYFSTSSTENTRKHEMGIKVQRTMATARGNSVNEMRLIHTEISVKSILKQRNNIYAETLTVLVGDTNSLLLFLVDKLINPVNAALEDVVRQNSLFFTFRKRNWKTSTPRTITSQLNWRIRGS